MAEPIFEENEHGGVTIIKDGKRIVMDRAESERFMRKAQRWMDKPESERGTLHMGVAPPSKED